MAKRAGEQKASQTPTRTGREWLLDELQSWFESAPRDGQAVLLGPPGIGKTTVARAFGESVPGSVYLDFSTLTEHEEWPAALTGEFQGIDPPSLLVLDSVERANSFIWRTRRLRAEFPSTPILFVFRPGVQYEGLQQPGTAQFFLTPDRTEHQQEIAAYLLEHGLEAYTGTLTTHTEANFLLGDLNQGLYQLEAYHLALWRETTRPLNGAVRVLVEQVALLLADTPEGLSIETITDFTGIPAVQIREAVDHLTPLLAMDRSGLRLYSKGFASYLTYHFSRDLGPVHGRIVTFFRETYPSWQEMHDAYGWRYLVLHCDRLARASRRQDFSILHWLNEGSFSMLKLERTGMLPSVLKDLRLSLIASIETRDFPRIVSFGHRIAKLRKQESVRTVHRLADGGELPLARENAFLVSGEGHRFLIWLLFVSQAIELDSLETAKVLLAEASSFPTLDLGPSEVELAGSLMATIMAHPNCNDEHRSQLTSLLEMTDPVQACLALISAGRYHELPKPLRRRLFERGLELSERIPFEEQRKQRTAELKARLARLDQKTSPEFQPYPDRLEIASDPQREWARLQKEVRSGILPIATAAASLIPFSDQAWGVEGYLELCEMLDSTDPEQLQHALSGLIQSLEDSRVKELDERLQDALQVAILTLDRPKARSRFLARSAVMLHRKGRPLEAQQKISLAAANAFGVVDKAERAEALMLLAQQVAAMGTLARARDLSFHALELAAKIEDLDRECRQLVLLLHSSTAQQESAEEIVRMADTLKFGDSPLEHEGRGRALVTLAAGLARLGAEEQAQTYRDKAIVTTHELEDSELKVHLLSELAAAFYRSDDKRRARKLFREAKALYEKDGFLKGLMSTTAMLRVSVVLENQAQVKRFYEACKELLIDPGLRTWLTSSNLLDLLDLSGQLGRRGELEEALTALEDTEDLTDRERLGLLRCKLHLEQFAEAEEWLMRIHDLKLRCQAHVDIALALLPVQASRSLEHLSAIPLESVRTEGIQRLALLNGTEIRPTEQHRVREVLNYLTLMAMDHPGAMDAVLGRWLQICPDRETLLAVAEKMGWPVTPPQHDFREFLQTQSSEQSPAGEVSGAAPVSPAEDGRTEGEPTEPDDGFQAIQLTAPHGTKKE